jgi:integrase
MTMIDTGIRRAELVALNWDDLNIESGLIRIAKGKGGKARSIVVGVKTRRALLKYRRTISHEPGQPIFQTRDGSRFTFGGLRSALLRIGREAGVKLSPHTLRRTFATLSLRNKMNAIHLQGLMGHSSLEMTRRYIQMLEGDLIEAHKDHGPIDNL